MSLGDEYRTKAAALAARAKHEADPLLSGELVALARSYLRLAEQADRNAMTDIVYEPPSARDCGPQQQQQHQSQQQQARPQQQQQQQQVQPKPDGRA